jgi:hypothetical protein
MMKNTLLEYLALFIYSGMALVMYYMVTGQNLSEIRNGEMDPIDGIALLLILNWSTNFLFKDKSNNNE